MDPTVCPFTTNTTTTTTTTTTTIVIEDFTYEILSNRACKLTFFERRALFRNIMELGILQEP